MAAIEPTLKSLLTYAKLLDTPEGQAAIAAYDAALVAVQGWKSGTPAQNVLTLIGDFQTVFATLPIPANVETLVNIILAGIETVIGVLTANSPAPGPTVGVAKSDAASPEERTALYQVHVIAETTAKVKTLVPTFQRSFWHSASYQYKKTWNDQLTIGGFPQTMHEN
jgi:hypothetical protein